MQHLDRPDDDAAVGVAADDTLPGVAETGVLGGLEGDRGQQASVDRVPGERAGQVAAAVEPGVQGGGVRDLALDDVVAELADAEGAGGQCSCGWWRAVRRCAERA